MSDNALFLLPALRRARDLIDRDYALPLDLDAMSREAGYSRFHFARAFAAAYGETPRWYLTRRRIERAKTLLRTANLSVTEICLLVGFASLGSFSSRFRDLVGQSPTDLMWTRPLGEVPQAQRSEPSNVEPSLEEPQPKEIR